MPHTSKSKGVVNATQMKPLARRFQLPRLDNDLTLLRDYPSFILPRREGSAGSWIQGAQVMGVRGGARVNESDFRSGWDEAS